MAPQVQAMGEGAIAKGRGAGHQLRSAPWHSRATPRISAAAVAQQLRDKNTGDVSKSQSTWTACKMETPDWKPSCKP
jgi:hypothetical protein